MAESQEIFPYDSESIGKIKESLSSERFKKYMNMADGDSEYAASLYLYNARLSKAFLFPIHICEVSVRNRIDKLFCQLGENHWPRNASFRRKFSKESLDSLDKCIERIDRNNKSQSQKTDDVVAGLSFDFWSNTLRPEYAKHFWDSSLSTTFPNILPNQGRVDVQNLMKSVSDIRNRIAHHEPILDTDWSKKYKEILELTGMCCKQTARWMKHHCTIGEIAKGRPSKQKITGEKVRKISDGNFILTKPDDKLSILINSFKSNTPSCIIADDVGAPVGVVTASEILHYLSDKADVAGGAIDFGDHTFTNVINYTQNTKMWSSIDIDDTIENIREILKAPRMRAVAVTENGIVCGSVVKSHRRY